MWRGANLASTPLRPEGTVLLVEQERLSFVKGFCFAALVGDGFCVNLKTRIKTATHDNSSTFSATSYILQFLRRFHLHHRVYRAFSTYNKVYDRVLILAALDLLRQLWVQFLGLSLYSSQGLCVSQVSCRAFRAS